MVAEPLSGPGAAWRAGDSRRAARATPTALALAPPELHGEMARACQGLALKLECTAATDLFVSRIESGCPPLLLVDADLMGWPADLCKFARSLRPDVKVLALTCQWSEHDGALTQLVDGILHKPPRRSQWEGVFEQMGVERKGGPGNVARTAT